MKKDILKKLISEILRTVLREDSSGASDDIENAKKEVGIDNLNLLQDFLNKTYPDKVADKMLKEAIKDKDLRAQLLDQRTKMLNSSVPGGNKVSISNYNSVTHKDVYEARDVMMNSRGKARVEAQKRYVALSSQLAHAGQ